MICFSDNCNAIFLVRIALKTKIGKDSLHLNNSLLDKPISSSTNKLLSQFINLKNNRSFTNYSMEYIKSCFRKSC